jgi:phosphate transport system substrate-binding protein
MKLGNVRRLTLVVGVTALLASACNTQGSGGGEGDLSGAVKVDGSSTVFPITEALAEEFRAEQPGVTVRVGQSGTGGGFEKFCNGETDLSDASRAIDDDEKAACAKKGIEPIELKVAIDGLSVVVNKQNDFVDCMTVADLKKVWEPGSKVKTWKDIRSEWPADEIKLYGPGSDSGTFDYFTAEIVGEESASRSDYSASEDDNILVQGVIGDKNAFGYFGYSYLEGNLDSLRAIGIDSGEGCVVPTQDTIKGGEYKPLSRPLFVYVSDQALEKEHVGAFAEFYLDTVNAVLADVGYIPVPAEDLEASKEALSSA